MLGSNHGCASVCLAKIISVVEADCKLKLIHNKKRGFSYGYSSDSLDSSVNYVQALDNSVPCSLH